MRYGRGRNAHLVALCHTPSCLTRLRRGIYNPKLLMSLPLLIYCLWRYFLKALLARLANEEYEVIDSLMALNHLYLIHDWPG